MPLAPLADRAVLVAPAPFGGELRAPVVAAAIARGLEAAGLRPPDLCPVTSGGAGTIEVLLPALGGETGDGFALLEDGGTALVEPGAGPDETANRLLAASAAGPAVIVLAAADAGPAHATAALATAHDDIGAARVVVLVHPADPGDRAELPPRGRAVSGPAFVLDALDADVRLRAARAVVVGIGRLDERALRGAVEGELAVRARQAGVPCHAVVGANALALFDTRILDLQRIVEGSTLTAVEAGAATIAEVC